MSGTDRLETGVISPGFLLVPLKPSRTKDVFQVLQQAAVLYPATPCFQSILCQKGCESAFIMTCLYIVIQAAVRLFCLLKWVRICAFPVRIPWNISWCFLVEMSKQSPGLEFLHISIKNIQVVRRIKRERNCQLHESVQV